ncbi:transmembrane protein, putative (macronuclear) [Tetrahymena thermophila SB210]|uniref:Transmembrane protein, putative n=1 Tax=Tetrahymena thermophila (strain SB210) TaxID=312017 RepID=W7XG02_TETTS|nr:transmembrane protein, putative [Tetrahymena thermophila SB210]EWS72991.1 transmembrane protein, putative [Tetrahymena thermophila SB210]|eukprot:XP_012654475.1 transmembrane protein, putative [Tetrahymena thermophila SB210]
MLYFQFSIHLQIVNHINVVINFKKAYFFFNLNFIIYINIACKCSLIEDTQIDLGQNKSSANSNVIFFKAKQINQSQFQANQRKRMLKIKQFHTKFKSILVFFTLFALNFIQFFTIIEKFHFFIVVSLFCFYCYFLDILQLHFLSRRVKGNKHEIKKKIYIIYAKPFYKSIYLCIVPQCISEKTLINRIFSNMINQLPISNFYYIFKCLFQRQI